MGERTVSGKLLDAVAVTGAGSALIFQGTRNNHTIQVKSTGAPTGVKVTLKGTTDLGNYATIATWDTAAGQVDGDILVVSGPAVIGVKASLDTLTGGTVPTVTATYVGTDT